MITVIASGYFDPLHVGHIEYLEAASELGNRLIVIVNNDHQAELKKGQSFMHEDDRVRIVNALACVDEVYLSVDNDASVCRSIKDLWVTGPVEIFAKGGDRLATEIPEAKLCNELKIEIRDGLGEKIRSSSSYTGLK